MYTSLHLSGSFVCKTDKPKHLSYTQWNYSWGNHSVFITDKGNIVYLISLQLKLIFFFTILQD